MITKENFQKVLECLGFEKDEHTYSKTFTDLGSCTISVDFKNKQLNYPEDLGFTIKIQQNSLVISTENSRNTVLEKIALSEKSGMFESVFGYKVILL